MGATTPQNLIGDPLLQQTSSLSLQIFSKSPPPLLLSEFLVSKHRAQQFLHTLPPPFFNSSPYLFAHSSPSYTPISFSLSLKHTHIHTQKTESQRKMSSKACITETQRKMSSKACKRVNSTPDINDKPTMTLKHTRVAGNRKKVAGICSFRLPKNSGFSPMNFLRRLSAKVVRALRFVSLRRRRTSPKVSASSLGRSRSYVSPIDSHRTEAIEDCIEFINSSSSFQRSNSVPAIS